MRRIPGFSVERRTRHKVTRDHTKPPLATPTSRTSVDREQRELQLQQREQMLRKANRTGTWIFLLVLLLIIVIIAQLVVALPADYSHLRGDGVHIEQLLQQGSYTT